MSPPRSRSTRTSGTNRTTRTGADDDSRADDGAGKTDDGRTDGAGTAPEEGGGDRHRSRRRPLRDILLEAREQLEDLLGRAPQAVTSVEREEDGWLVQVEILELERIPASTSILGLYDVHVDSEGNVLEYHRAGRYYRNQADEGGS